jgi:predicted GNAT family N-acyltransferase
MSNQARIKLVETPEEMDAVKALRVQVFVHEQKVPLDEEFDEYDGKAIHAIAMLDGRVVGTGRLYRNSSGETQIGRMAVDMGHRRRGIGGLILAFLEEQARRNGVDRVMLHAQTYVRSFYERHGYVAEGGPFMEVEIEHVRMVKRLE